MPDETTKDLTAAGEITDSGEPGRRGWGIWLVIGLGLGYGLLNWTLGDSAGASVLWWLDPLLLVGFAVGWWLLSRRPGRFPQLKLSGGVAAVAFIGGSWLAGMLYELSLRTGATGFGGMHVETGMSFLLAQGYYLPFAIGGWWLARRYGYSAAAVFWTGALVSLYEVITVGVPAIFAEPNYWLLAPLILGYYLYVYALILALPLLIMDESGLWANIPRPIGTWGKVWRGVLFGLLCWVVFVGWAAVMGAMR